MRRLCLSSLVLALALLSACARPLPPPAQPPPTPPAGEAEAVSLLGRPLVAPELPAELRRQREAQLAEARAAAEARPDDPDALIWLGRRTAYLGRYREAIGIFTRGVTRFPQDARFLRHRGHRHLSLRRFDLAEGDLEAAARLVFGRPDEVEPDGLPNAAGIPTSTLQSNIWYHLGLARYLQGDFAAALPAYRAGLEVAKNPDMQVATRQWLYLTLRRLGRDAEAAEVLAPVHADMEILENQAYHRLLLLARGEVSAADLLAAKASSDLDPASLGYGVGAWYLVQGQREEALRTFLQVVETGPWSAFGVIAAEAELHRLGEGK
ncbi:MAG TPA: tetratricopeptide repeat protein [Thermoanaerobaculia bacterium]|nr:tetratricopeptide repeat protein [Thermoanaerobaculia bacterium]